MAWIESHQELREHPKVKRLARLLDVSRPQAIGHLHLLWWWALDYAQDGDVSGYEDWEIADAGMWEGEPAPFVNALRACKLLDEDGRFNDWDEYAGKLLERRRTDAERKRRERGLPPEPPAPSNGHPQDIQRTARVTVPNRTEPNQTKPKPPTASAVGAAGAAPPVDAGPDPAREVYEHFKAKIHPASRVFPRDKIRRRLKRFTVAELTLGIDHFAADWWCMENNATRGADWFFANDARSEHYLTMKPKGEPESNVVPIRHERTPMNGTARVQPTAGVQVGLPPVDAPNEAAREMCLTIGACGGRSGRHHDHCPDNPRWAERRAS